MSNLKKDDPIRVSVETLARHASDNWRQQLRSLQSALDRQISALEASLDAGDHKPLIDAAVKQVSQAAADRAEQVRQQAEATAAQALAAIEVELRARLSAEIAANTTLRSALDEAKRELESAQNKVAKAEAAQRAAAAQHAQTLNDQKKLTTALNSAQAQLVELQGKLKTAQHESEHSSASLTASQQQVQELLAERGELLERINNVTSSKTALEGQYRQLESVSQKLSSALAQMLRERDPDRASTADRPVPPPLPQKKEAVRAEPVKAASKSAAAGHTPPVGGATAQKKPLQFSERARDIRRVKIRRGIDVLVDGIPGELVDLSVGGAQAILRQAVRANQLVRLVLLTAAGQVICKGRVVWVVYEQPGTSLSVYRTGLKFSDVDAAQVEAFMHDFCDEPPIADLHSSGVA